MTVTLVDESDIETAQTESGDDGAFSLTTPRHGLYRLRAHALGYDVVASEPAWIGATDTTVAEPASPPLHPRTPQRIEDHLPASPADAPLFSRRWCVSIHVVTRRSFTADDMEHALDEFWKESARDPGLQRRLRALGLSDAELERARAEPSTVTQSAAGFDATAIVIVLTPVVARVASDVWEQIILPWLKAKYGPDVTKEQEDEPDAR